MGPGGSGQPPGPRVAIVSSAEVAAEPGQPLNARYWVERDPGEGYAHWLRRQGAEDLERRAAKHEAAAGRLRAAAAQMRADMEAG